MKQLRPWGHLVIAAAILGWASLPFAQALPQPTPAASTPSVQPPASSDQSEPLSVTAAGDPNNRVGQGIYVVISIRNISGGPLLLKNLNVALDGSSQERFDPPLACPLQRDGEIKLVRGLVFEQTCRFQMKPASVWGGGAGLQSSLLSADIRLQVTADLDQRGSFQYFPGFTVKAPEIGIFIGGFAGALMLALFVWIDRTLKNPIARQAWITSALVTLIMGFRGGLMAIIALLISKTTQGAGSPVSLTVSDFGGGILVGLFSYPLAAWISSTLKLDSSFVPKTESPPAPQSGSDAAPATGAPSIFHDPPQTTR